MLLGLLFFAQTASAQMQRVQGVDRNGMAQPMPAFAVTVPQGWNARGGIVWGNHDPCNRYGFDFSWAAMSPDQRHGVAILPAVRWINGPITGVQCQIMQIGSVQDLLQKVIGQISPQAQMLDYRARPDLLQEVGLKPSGFDLGGGAYMKTHVDAGEALFSFPDDNGRPMRGSIMVAVVLNETFMPGGGVMANMQFIQGETLPAWLAFAPDGNLNLNISEQIRKSLEMNPAWHRLIMDHQSKINKDNARTSQNIANINRETNSYISRLSQEGHENRMRAMDRTSEAFSNMMLEREVWRDTDGSRLNAPMGGDNLWRLDDGTYASTNDHNFNPLAETGQFGTQLERWE